MIRIAQKGNNSYPEDVNVLLLSKRIFYCHAQFFIEYIEDNDPSKDLLNNLKSKGVDLFTFVQRSFMMNAQQYPFPNEVEPIALLKITSFENWWNSQIRKEERNLVRKAGKKGIKIETVEIDENFIKGTQMICNETPIRQGRRYIGYGISRAALKRKFQGLSNSDVFGAYYNKELVGILWLVYGDRVARIRSFLSLIRHRDKAPNNALMAAAVSRCCERGFHFIVYEKLGYLPNLDVFKIHNGFRGVAIPRYYIPLSERGEWAIKFKMNRDMEHFFAPRIARFLLPVYSLVSRVTPEKVWWRFMW
jgi:hypothetical protein